MRPARPSAHLLTATLLALLLGWHPARSDDGPAAAIALRVVADCEGPHGRFTTVIHSAADGRMSMEQAWPDGRSARMGVDSSGVWVWDEWAGAAAPAGDAELAFLRGHEFHALTLWPGPRLGAPVRRTSVPCDGSPCERLEYLDPLRQPLVVDRDRRSGLLRRLQVTSPATNGPREIVATSEIGPDSAGRAGLRGVVIAQADSRWRYAFRSVVEVPADVASLDRPNPRTDREQLLALHESALRAHRRNDVDELLAPESDDYLVASRGEISRPDRAARRERFGSYFSRTRFSEYRDLLAPEVRVSADGTLGWVLANVRVEGEQDPTGSGAGPAGFAVTWAWIELYEKREGRWWRTGNISNRGD